MFVKAGWIRGRRGQTRTAIVGLEDRGPDPLDDAPAFWRACTDSNRDRSFRKPVPSPVRWTGPKTGGRCRNRTDPGRIKRPVPRHLGISPGSGHENLRDQRSFPAMLISVKAKCKRQKAKGNRRPPVRRSGDKKLAARVGFEPTLWRINSALPCQLGDLAKNLVGAAESNTLSRD